MPWSFWHAFSKSLVAVAISSPVTWHNVSWAIDWAMRCKRSLFHLGCDNSVNWAAVAPVGDGQWAALLQVVGLPRWLRKGERQAIQRRNARAYIRPLQSTQCCACHAKATGDQGTPGRTSDPLQSTKCCACHIKATRNGDQGTPERTSDPCRAPSAAPATQKPPEEQQRPAYIRHLRSTKCCRSNTALCGNQGSPQPGSPRSHGASHQGITTHNKRTLQCQQLQQLKS